MDPRFLAHNYHLVDPAQFDIVSTLVEACVTSHYRRFYPTFYIKAEGEVDIAYVKDERFWPVEVKWTQQLQKSELKQLAKYPNGIVLTKKKERDFLDSFSTIPLPLALYNLEENGQFNGPF